MELVCNNLNQLKLTVLKVADQFHLIGMIGMTLNTSRNKDRLLLNSKRNKRNSKLPTAPRKRRRSPRRRRSLDPQVETFLTLTLLRITVKSIRLVSMLSRSLTWTRKTIVTITRKKRFRKI